MRGKSPQPSFRLILINGANTVSLHSAVGLGYSWYFGVDCPAALVLHSRARITIDHTVARALKNAFY